MQLAGTQRALSKVIAEDTEPKAMDRARKRMGRIGETLKEYGLIEESKTEGVKKKVVYGISASDELKAFVARMEQPFRKITEEVQPAVGLRYDKEQRPE